MAVNLISTVLISMAVLPTQNTAHVGTVNIANWLPGYIDPWDSIRFVTHGFALRGIAWWWRLQHLMGYLRNVGSGLGGDKDTELLIAQQLERSWRWRRCEPAGWEFHIINLQRLMHACAANHTKCSRTIKNFYAHIVNSLSVKLYSAWFPVHFYPSHALGAFHLPARVYTNTWKPLTNYDMLWTSSIGS